MKVQAELKAALKKCEPYEALLKERQPTLDEAKAMDSLANEVIRLNRKLERVRRGCF